MKFEMIKHKSFNDSHGNFFFYINWILVCLWTWKNFSPDTLRLNLEVLNFFIYAWIVMKFKMIKHKSFIDSQVINFCISFYFIQKLDLSVFVDLEKFQPDTLVVNFEVLDLHLCMDYCEFALSDE